MNRQSLANLLNRGFRIGVVGDVVLDRYTWGSSLRVSPEAPVTILEADSEEVRLGGAAAVAMLLANLGASVKLAGVVGDDPEGRTLNKLLDDAAVNRAAIIMDPARSTTHKQRIMGRAAGRHAQQMMRVDRETRNPLDAATRRMLAARIRQLATESDCLVISDYAKGTCHPEVLELLIQSGVPVMVDPGVGVDWRFYRGSALIKPNRKEAELITGRTLASPGDALAAAHQLHEQHGAAIVITLDQDGLVFVDALGCDYIPTRKREVYDVTGAGDTAIALLALASAAAMPLSEAGHLVNLAAGIQVEHLGVAPIQREDLYDAWERCPPAASKIVNLAAASRQRQTWQKQQQQVVFTNGCFDLLHVGHVRMLQEAAAMGDRLIVAVNSDASVRSLKGSGRPVIDQSGRAEMLAALACVDLVVVFDDHTPVQLLLELRPDVLVKGGTTEVIVGSDIVEAYGGRVGRNSTTANVSTTTLLAAAASKT